MKNRVRSIAAIHEMLYGSTDLSRIDFESYLNTIAKDLMAFYSKVTNRVKLKIESASIELDITQAVPCGLIANELLTNCFKYAFPAGRSGVVRVTFNCIDEQCTLEISDNGIGLPVAIDPQESPSMGLQLVALLVQQIKGKMELDRTGGTRFSINFTKKPF
jgi:two-component sensor histidine kinase